MKTIFTKAKKAAKILRTVDNNIRKRIVEILSVEYSMSVTDLYIRMRFENQSQLSQHLSILRSQKIVTTRRDGKVILYSINRSRMKQIAKFCESIANL